MLLVSSWVGAAREEAIIQELPGRAWIDWSRGVLFAVGVGAPDLAAKDPEIARVGALRRAEHSARERLERAALAVPLAGGGVLGARIVDDGVARLRKLVAEAKKEATYSSDGTVEVRTSAPLERLWQVVSGSEGLARMSAAPHAESASRDSEVRAASNDRNAPTRSPSALIVDARGLLLAPALGIYLESGDVRYMGSAVWHRDRKAALADPRAPGGTMIVGTRLAGPDVIQLAVEPRVLDDASRRGAQVVIICRGAP